MTGSNDPVPPSRAGKPELDDETVAFAGRMFQYARAGHIEELRAFLGMGLPPNILNQAGDSLLMLASYHGHAELVSMLLQRGGDPELANDRGQTPLAAAAFKGDLPVVAALLKGGADVNGSGPDGRTALMLAAMFNRTSIVEHLLGNGADPLARDAGRLTAEELAREMGAPDSPAQLAKAALR